MSADGTVVAVAYSYIVVLYNTRDWSTIDEVQCQVKHIAQVLRGSSGGAVGQQWGSSGAAVGQQRGAVGQQLGSSGGAAGEQWGSSG